RRSNSPGSDRRRGDRAVAGPVGERGPAAAMCGRHPGLPGPADAGEPVTEGRGALPSRCTRQGRRLPWRRPDQVAARGTTSPGVPEDDMASRKFRVTTTAVNGKAVSKLHLDHTGPVPEPEIMAELQQVAARHNLFPECGLFQEAAAPSGARLGGMTVPSEKRATVFQDLRGLGYQLDE